MSVSVGTAASSIPRTWSLGPYKIQVFDIPHVSGDTTATCTADTMTTVLWASLASSVVQTSAPTYSGNVATFTFTNPAATVKAQAIVFGV